MTIDRKGFLRLTGLGAAAWAAGKFAAGFPGRRAETPNGEAGRAPRRWALVVDSRKCRQSRDCDLCIRACTRAHNIPEIGDPRHEIRWIRKATFQEAFVSDPRDSANERFRDLPLVVLCNHCDRPPCVRVCPVQATWKRDDGIVMMDEHRCIGCRYCMAACPYGSRSFNFVDPRPFIRELSSGYPTRTRGVVEKCSFCVERLDGGGLPACVEACESKALVFGDLDDPGSAVRAAVSGNFTLRRKAELGTGPEVYYIV